MPDLTRQPPASSSYAAPLRLEWAGNPWALTGLCFLNVVLIVITLGIYWFWARAEYRKYMWQMVRLNGEPLEYTGTGMELLAGYVRVFLFVFLPIVAVTAGAQIVLGPKNPIVLVAGPIVYLVLFFLYFAGFFRAHRYILSRTRWRGIAFGLDPGAGRYGWKALWTVFLTGLTLGWLYPWRTLALRRQLVNAMRFGSIPFRFEGSSGTLYAPFAFLWVFLILAFGAMIALQLAATQALLKARTGQAGGSAQVTLHWQDLPHAPVWIILAVMPFLLLGWSWFEARKLSAFARATKIEGVDLALSSTGGSVLWLTISNLFILFFSVGILRPVAQARRLRYLVERTTLSGVPDLDDVKKGAESAGMQGAGLEAAFSIEIF